MADARSIGWRQVLIVGAIAVVAVLGAAVVTALLPADAQGVIFHTPLLIVVLVLGTAFVLWQLAKPRPPEQ